MAEEMRKSYYSTALCFLFLSTLAVIFSFKKDTDNILSYTADPAKQNVQLFWKDDKGQVFKSLGNLKSWAESKHKKLVFAMNGGMYMEDYRPLGLYIENDIEKKRINTASGYGNFYLKPNGVFYITRAGKAVICRTQDFSKDKPVRFATQSGPMLVINNKIHPAFKEGSVNLQIRNGVGILPDGKMLFAMSKTGINFYDFANFFLKAGCSNALFLDGFVCRTYLPEKNWTQTDGDFGVIIGVTTP